MPAEKKTKTSYTAREGLPAADRLVIDLTSSNGKKYKVARSKLVTSTMTKMASTIADKIAQCRGSVVLLVPKFALRYPLEAKSGSSLERLATMKNDKVDSTAKVALRPNLFAVETDSPAKK
ncbi:hypothetical protein ACFX12_034812 [Malus domestica]